LGDEGRVGIGREIAHTAPARHILGQVEIVRTRRPGRFRNRRRQTEGGGIEHSKLSVQQIDQG